MNTLFNNKLYPITSQIAFLDANIHDIRDEFLKWQTPIVSKYNNKFEVTTLKSNLQDTLSSLCPLTIAERRRYLLIPTKSKWVALFDNGHVGTDRIVPKILGESLNCKNIYITCDIKNESTMLDIYELSDGQVTLRRSIGVMKEGKWNFIQYGDKLPFEEPENYTSTQIKKRFTLEILNRYLLKMGLNVFDEQFYDSEKAILIAKKGEMFKTTEELSLTEAQNYFKS